MLLVYTLGRYAAGLDDGGAAAQDALSTIVIPQTEEDPL